MLSHNDFKEKKVIVALLSHGERMSFKNDNIIIKNEAGDIRHQSSCYRLFSLFIVGHITITSGLLQRAKKFGFSIILLTHGLRYYGSWFAKAEGNVVLRRKQYEYNKTTLAQYLVGLKIKAQVNGLQQQRKKSVACQQSIASLREYGAKLPNTAYDFQQILGVEGIASKVYFKSMFDNIEWNSRKPRVKHDTVNCLLDIGYTQLFNFMDALLNLYGFDCYQGVYHQAFYQRKSLVCDLVEPFRPIVDYGIRKAYNLNQVKESDFIYDGVQYRLFGKVAQPYIQWQLKNLLTHKEDMFYFVQSYYRQFMKQSEIDSYPIPKHCQE